MSNTQAAERLVRTEQVKPITHRWLRLAEPWRCSHEGCNDRMRTCQRVLWFSNGAVLCEAHGQKFQSEALELADTQIKIVPEPTKKPNRRQRRERTIPH